MTRVKRSCDGPHDHPTINTMQFVNVEDKQREEAERDVFDATQVLNEMFHPRKKPTPRRRTTNRVHFAITNYNTMRSPPARARHGVITVVKPSRISPNVLWPLLLTKWMRICNASPPPCIPVTDEVKTLTILA